MPSLPQELTDMIIRYLQLPTDYSALLACCLVSRAFSHTALSKLHFAAYIGKQNVKKASESLTANVAQYVRELYLYSSLDDSSWLSDGSLVALLRQLFQLQKMRFHGCNWSALSSDLQMEITRIFQGQRFHHVQIFGVAGLPITLLSSFTSLKHLEISSISLEAPSGRSQLTPSIILGHLPVSPATLHSKPAEPSIYLESLGLAVLSGELPSVSVGVQNRDMISVLDFLLSPSTPLNVTRLGVISFDTEPLNKDFERSLSHLLDACSATVNRVKMYSPIYTDNSPFTSTPISFKKHHHLESLVILVSYIETSIMRWLVHVLSTFEPSNHMRNIQIVFILRDGHYQVADNEWKLLNTVLALPAFVYLSKFIIEWSVFPGALTLDEEQGTTFENLAKSKLPFLIGRKILEVRKMRCASRYPFG